MPQILTRVRTLEPPASKLIFHESAAIRPGNGYCATVRRPAATHPMRGGGTACGSPKRSGYRTCTRYNPPAGAVTPPAVRVPGHGKVNRPGFRGGSNFRENGAVKKTGKTKKFSPEVRERRADLQGLADRPVMLPAACGTAA